MVAGRDEAADHELTAARRRQALELVSATRRRWRFLLERIDAALAPLRDALADLGLGHLRANLDERLTQEPDATLFRVLQDRTIRVSWKLEVRAPLERIFSGLAFAPLLGAIDATHRKVLRGRVFVALHMHAGDGNVHTNIPVNSDD